MLGHGTGADPRPGFGAGQVPLPSAGGRAQALHTPIREENNSDFITS